MNYSDRAKQNMTNQMKAQLRFLQNNLAKKQKRLDKTKRWLNHKYYSKLPGLKWTLQRQLNGTNKVRKDIDMMTERIITMEKEGKIFPIITSDG